MKYIIIIIAALFLSSCGSSVVTSDELSMISTKLTLDKAKELFSDLFDSDEDVVKTKVKNKDYTIIILKRVTSAKKETYQVNSGSRYSTDYNGRSVYQGTSTDTKTNKFETKTNFYLIFDGQNYVFSGYGYEAKINHNRKLLTELIDFTQAEEEVMN